MPKLLRNGENAGHQRWLPQSPPPPEPVFDPAQIREEIVQQARREAAALLATARADTDAVRQQARDAGYADGYADASTTAQAEYQAQVGELFALLDEIAKERVAFFARAEIDLARLATVIAEKIVTQQLAIRPETVVDITRACLKRLRDREEIFVRAHPDDMPILAEARPSLLLDIDGMVEFHLIEDRRITRGGIIVETKSGSLDARVASQLGVVTKAMESAVEDTGEPAAE
jgi:flagellar biosynthesis/type III secretory pathway protein FliH